MKNKFIAVACAICLLGYSLPTQADIPTNYYSSANNKSSTSDATLTITPKSGTSASTFTVSPTTISKADLASGITITLTYSGNVKTAGATFTLAGTALDGLGHTTLNLKGSYVAGE